MVRRLRVGILAAAFALLPGPVGAQDGSPSGEVTAPVLTAELRPQYVGATAAGDVYGAVIEVGSGIVQVYLCDGVSLGAWFVGQREGDTFEAQAADGSTASGTFEEGTVNAVMELADGTTLELTMPLAVPPAGFYSRETVEDGQAVRVRVIVLPDGTAKGLLSPLGLTWDPTVSDASCVFGLNVESAMVLHLDDEYPKVFAFGKAVCDPNVVALITVTAILQRRNVRSLVWETVARDVQASKALGGGSGIPLRSGFAYALIYCPTPPQAGVYRAIVRMTYQTTGGATRSLPELRTASKQGLC